MAEYSQDQLIRLARLYGIHPYVRFEDVFPFGDAHDVGKVHPQLAEKIKAFEEQAKQIKDKA